MRLQTLNVNNRSPALWLCYKSVCRLEWSKFYVCDSWNVYIWAPGDVWKLQSL